MLIESDVVGWGVGSFPFYEESGQEQVQLILAFGWQVEEQVEFYGFGGG